MCWGEEREAGAETLAGKGQKWRIEAAVGAPCGSRGYRVVRKAGAFPCRVYQAIAQEVWKA